MILSSAVKNISESEKNQINILDSTNLFQGNRES